MAAYQQLRRIEDHWRHNTTSSRRPLRTTTSWYKPTIDESGKGSSSSRAVPRYMTIDAPSGEVHAEKLRSGRDKKKKTGSSSAKQQEQLKKRSDDVRRVSTKSPSEGPAIRLRRALPAAREPIEIAKDRPAYLHQNILERHAQPRAGGNTVTVAEASPTWKEVRWTASEPMSTSRVRVSRPAANTKAIRRNNSGLPPNSAAAVVNQQHPVKAQTGRVITTAEDRTKSQSLTLIGDAAGPSIIVLVHRDRPPRLRSPSRVRVRPKPYLGTSGYGPKTSTDTERDVKRHSCAGV